MREQATRDAGVALHRGEIARPVLAADCQPGHEMVEDEVVQHDDPGTPPQRFDDPAVRLGVVADVVERNVAGAGTRPAAADDLDVDETP